jgi:hypothetical protein
LFCVLGLALPVQGRAAPLRNKYALLVGVKEYDHARLGKLKYTENDVEELAKVLGNKRAGFSSVRLLTTSRGKKRAGDKPTIKNIRKALKQLLAKKTRRDLVLVALSGHGIQMEVEKKEESFFCPSDAQISDTSTMINLGKLFKDLDACGARVRLLLVDACRNDPKESRSLDVDDLPRPARGTAALFSCDSGQKSYETPKLGKGHGVFFHHVLEGLRGKARNADGEVTWQDLTGYVQRQVPRVVPKLIGGGAQQSPELVGRITGAPVLMEPEEKNGGEGKPEPLKKTTFPNERAELAKPSWQKDFPKLGGNFEVRGRSTPGSGKGSYNSISWSIGRKDLWVWPGDKREAYDRLYGKYGYRRGKMDFSRQAGIDKIILYGKPNKARDSITITGAALHLPDGSWSIKLGRGPLIRYLHPDDLNGPEYGKPVAVYTRRAKK